MNEAQTQRQAFDDDVREAAGGSAAAIATAKELLDAGNDHAEEFEALRAKALS